jgi:hypothetical protein
LQLYDAINTISPLLSPSLCENSLTLVREGLLGGLCALLTQLPLGDPEQPFLLDCLTSIVPYLEADFSPFAHRLWSAVLRIVESQIAAVLAARNAGVSFAGDVDLLASCCDTMSAVSEALGGAVADLVEKSNAIELLQHCCTVQDAVLRASSFSLVGELSKTAWPHVAPHSCFFLQHASAVINEVKKSSLSAGNNAVWATGEMIRRMPHAEVMAAAVSVAPALFKALSSGIPSAMLHHNAAVVVSRIATKAAPALCSLLVLPPPTWAQLWVRACAHVTDKGERREAYEGLCYFLAAAPSAAQQLLVPVCHAFAASYDMPPDALRGMMREILLGCKRTMRSDEWKAATDALNELCRQKLEAAFGPGILP